MATEINTNSEAYNDGYESAKQGLARTACPYEAQAWNRIQWLAGYDDGSRDTKHADQDAVPFGC